MSNQKKKSFLKLPQYPGGKTALQKYIKENLIYPAEAKEAGIEGIVYLSAEIDDNGIIGGVEVAKGLGYGCDEEAIRLVKSIKFGGVTNRGKRLKTKKKFRISFKLGKQPKKKVSFSIKTETKKEDTTPKQTKYNYIITVKK
ncbi:hypothetical protein MNBD_BACTEROID01-2420 [hydrothermal vent metagenome]|uniref:TonB C-terminal domain-containing protein n=1 Tax=hydrothermal vent metagenome TaxID=652676 RepID=A0A3B0TNL0_9ZZZZ